MNYQDFEYTETDSAPWTAPTRSDAQLLPLTPNPLIPVNPNTAQTNAGSAVSEMWFVGSMLQSMQRAQMQQMYLLRDLDTRLARLENPTRGANANTTPSFERATWWAIWGLLMLILGGALTVVIMLILMNLQLR